MAEYLRPVELARSVGLSAQSIRKYERWGFLPPAERSPAGYRRYTARHLEALQTARAMIAGYGWMPALRIMREVHRGQPEAVPAMVDERHAELHRERKMLEETLTALRAVAGVQPEPQPGKGPTGRRALLTVGEAARRAGVRPSAVRFWEAHGLLRPRRDPESGYRLYDEEEVRRLQIVTLLRKANYGREVIRAVLAQLTAGRLDEAVTAAEERLRDLSQASRRCMAATAALHAYLAEEPDRA
ncbi:MAG: MerR family transcriptional regulator [Bacillota bacterium]